MKLRFFLITLYTLILIGTFNSTYGKTNNFNYNAKNISNYFSALISFDDYDYLKSQDFFKKIKDSKKDKSRHSSRHIQSLISLGRYIEAEKYSKNLENKNIANFESRLVLGLMELKKGNNLKAKTYFSELSLTREHQMVFNVLKISLRNWSSMEELGERDGILSIEKMPRRYRNFKKIQKVLANCFFDSDTAEKKLQELPLDKESNMTRYNFFHANYLLNKKNKIKALEIINNASKNHPNNLLINQLQETTNKNEKNLNEFNCKNKNHVVAEIFYVTANAISVQNNFDLSNFYINLAKYLNPNFSSYDSLLAENYFILKKYDKSKKIYEKLSKIGKVYNWFASRQIAFILDEQNKKKEAINFLTSSFENLDANVYQTYEFANFLKNRENFKKSIELYSNILEKINDSHQLYPKVLDKRGTAYERINKWDLAEKDLLMSLKYSPEQPYVINYLAYTWLEQGKNFDKALKMLQQANELRRDDGYITDSLGWALYKLNRYEEAKEFLKIAIILMPTDPIVNDHFADCLWKNNEKIQARYYWNYVLKLETTEKKLKKIIENKLIFGLENT